MCDITVGDVVCDAMCGGASIGVEAALKWRQAFHLAADVHETAVVHARENLDAVEAKQKYG